MGCAHSFCKEVCWGWGQGWIHTGQEANKDYIFLTGSWAEATSGSDFLRVSLNQVWLPLIRNQLTCECPSAPIGAFPCIAPAAPHLAQTL